MQLNGQGPIRNDGTFLPAQMTDEWILDVLARMADSPDPDIRRLGEVIRDVFQNNPEKLTKLVAALDRRSGSSGILNIMKIGG